MATGGATFRFVERGGWGNAMYHLLLLGFSRGRHTAAGSCRGRARLRKRRAGSRKIAGVPARVQATKATRLRARCLHRRDGPAQTKLAASEDAGGCSFVGGRPSSRTMTASILNLT
jgi:hypothetical protein